MAVGVTLMIVSAIIILIWIFVEFKRFKHKFYAIFLIVLILFAYLGFVSSIKGKEIDFKSIDGLRLAGSLYFSWLKNVFSNTKSITSNAIALDWKGENSTSES